MVASNLEINLCLFFFLLDDRYVDKWLQHRRGCSIRRMGLEGPSSTTLPSRDTDISSEQHVWYEDFYLTTVLINDNYYMQTVMRMHTMLFLGGGGDHRRCIFLCIYVILSSDPLSQRSRQCRGILDPSLVVEGLLLQKMMSFFTC